MLIPKKVKENVKTLIFQEIKENKLKIEEIKEKAFIYIYERLPWWADLLFESFVEKRVEKWIDKVIEYANSETANV